MAEHFAYNERVGSSTLPLFIKANKTWCSSAACLTWAQEVVCSNHTVLILTKIMHILLNHFLGCFIFCSGMVAFSRNPINSLVFLLGTFFSASAIIIFFGADFIALTLIIVYVGAIAILFLFIIMLLKIKNREIPIRKNLLQGVLLTTVFMGGISLLYIYFFKAYSQSLNFLPNSQHHVKFCVDNSNSAVAFGQNFYNSSPLLLLLAGMILFVALVGAIVLTLNIHFNATTKKQVAEKQLATWL